jgi:two-component system, sensor histidine kinase
VVFRANQRPHDFLASAPDPTLIVDRTGSILFASTQMEAVFGYEPHELIGVRIESLMPDRFRQGHVSFFKSYFSTPKPRPMGAGLDLYALHKDGREFPVEISLSPLEDQSNLYVSCAIRDVSDRRKMEADLRATAARLDAAKNEAERANAVKSRFLAAASHDLRQPLQAATVYLSLLSKHANTHDQQQLCLKMRTPLQVMGNILNALLDISMLDSGLVTPKRSDFGLDTILERVAGDLRPLAQQKNLRFDYLQTHMTVNSDPALLERIVENLASNAIRYTTDGSVAVRAERIGAMARISIVDTGIGIREEALERIFEEYFQYDNAARNIKKGLGLGLAIVRRLAQLLDHPINVQSALGKGSTFSVDVPLAQKSTLTAMPMAGGIPTSDERALAVLFIDDDAAVADSLSMLLTGAGFVAFGASDGDEAIARCEEGLRPDVVISDYRMPNENGLIVAERLRTALRYEAPVIVMTGDTSLRHIEEQNIANLTVVQKPIDPDALIGLIHKMAALPRSKRISKP